MESAVKNANDRAGAVCFGGPEEATSREQLRRLRRKKVETTRLSAVSRIRAVAGAQ